MAKIQIKSEKLTPFGGIFSIMEKFDSMLSLQVAGVQSLVRELRSHMLCNGAQKEREMENLI